MNPVNRLFTLQSDREALPAIEEPRLPRRIRLANAAADSLNDAGRVIVNDIAPVVSGVFLGRWTQLIRSTLITVDLSGL